MINYKYPEILNFDCKDEIEEFLIVTLEEEETVQIICDYNYASFIAEVFMADEFEDYKSINIYSDVYEYSVYKDEDKAFIIEPAKNNEGWLDFELEDASIYIQLELVCNELIDMICSEDVSVFYVDDEECDYYCSEEDECECEDCERCNICGEYPCDCQCDEIEDVSDEDIDFRLLMEVFLDEIETVDNYNDKMEELYRLYNLGYVDGRKSLAYGLSDLMAEIVEE